MLHTVSPSRLTGFSLLEILISLGIIATITVVAYPAYVDYSSRGRIAQGIGALANIRLQTEQQYQDSRTYQSAPNTCVIAAPANKYFTLTCTNASATTYTWTAKSKANVGLGAINNYTFSIDENGNKTTTAFNGSTVNLTCWKASESGAC